MPRRPIISAISPGSSANSPRSASGSSTRRWSRPAPATRTPLMKGLARAKAYVAYAQAHPGMYGLMFRTERLDMSRPSLHEAADASFAGLAGCDRRQPPGADRGGGAVAGPGRRDRARLVAGARLYHAAARRPARRTSCSGCPRAPTAETAAGRDAACDGRPPAGGVAAQRLSALSSATLRYRLGQWHSILPETLARGDFVYEPICRTARLEWPPHPDDAAG